jgi:hypothetical protein
MVGEQSRGLATQLESFAVSRQRLFPATHNNPSVPDGAARPAMQELRA